MGEKNESEIEEEKEREKEKERREKERQSVTTALNTLIFSTNNLPLFHVSSSSHQFCKNDLTRERERERGGERVREKRKNNGMTREY